MPNSSNLHRETDHSRVAKINANPALLLAFRSVVGILLAIAAYFCTTIYSEMKGMSLSIAAMSANMATLKERVVFLAEHVGKLDERVNEAEGDVADLNGRVSRIEGREESRKQ